MSVIEDSLKHCKRIEGIFSSIQDYVECSFKRDAAEEQVASQIRTLDQNRRTATV